MSSKTTGIRRDHPRRCGENGGHVATVRDGVGSPPQVRGKPLEEVAKYGAAGITPAGAGKTPPRSIWTRAHWDHPRRCGENNLEAY